MGGGEVGLGVRRGGGGGNVFVVCFFLGGGGRKWPRYVWFNEEAKRLLGNLVCPEEPA